MELDSRFALSQTAVCPGIIITPSGTSRQDLGYWPRGILKAKSEQGARAISAAPPENGSGVQRAGAVHRTRAAAEE